ncbi:MAG: hypothetical protein R8G01_12255 [Ilumatobacteraceae bacterium]|nr:hypothetical protein [Ilumatobacteraceae bacterium]
MPANSEAQPTEGDSTDGDFFTRFREKSESFMRRGTSRQSDVVPFSTSTWLRIARFTAVAAATNSPGPMIVVGFDVLQSLAGIEDEQARLLASIEEQVEILRTGPFLVGRDLVEEAARSEDPQRQKELLVDALEQLRLARRHTKSVAEQGVVEAQLGYVQFLLDNRSEARYWWTEAHKHLSSEVERLIEEASDIKVFKSRRSATAVVYFYPAGIFVIAKKIRKVQRAERARLALAELQPVLTGLSQSLLAADGESLGSYEITQGIAHWELRKVYPALPAPS